MEDLSSSPFLNEDEYYNKIEERADEIAEEINEDMERDPSSAMDNWGFSHIPNDDEIYYKASELATE